MKRTQQEIDELVKKYQSEGYRITAQADDFIVLETEYTRVIVTDDGTTTYTK